MVFKTLMNEASLIRYKRHLTYYLLFGNLSVRLVQSLLPSPAMKAAALNSNSLLHFNETMQLPERSDRSGSRHSSEKSSSSDKSESNSKSSSPCGTPILKRDLVEVTEKQQTVLKPSKQKESSIKVKTEDKKVQTQIENKNVQAQTDIISAPHEIKTSDKNVQTSKKPSPLTSFIDRIEPLKEAGSKRTESKGTSPILSEPSSKSSSTESSTTTTRDVDNQITFGRAIVEFFKVSAELDESTSKCILYFLTSIVSEHNLALRKTL